jgi:Mn2+/Fe2+ NRAMP family transporter
MTVHADPGEVPVEALNEAGPVGPVRGALGTIFEGDHGPRKTWRHRWRTLLAIIGPGLIVMIGDNDAGGFGTYTQAGQNYGTALLWTLLLLVPVLYVNQEMVLRLAVVTGVGHARLIRERLGKIWGAFSIVDLLLLNGLTIVTEFIGISLALSYLGLPKEFGVVTAAMIIMAAVGTGDFRRFERFALALCAGSFLLVPVFLMIHPPFADIGRDLVVPRWPGNGKFDDIILLIVAIVGTTIAPWQLFFQQSYMVDKRLTPRFIKYERLDLRLGILIVTVGAVAMMAFAAATFAGRPEFGNFTDAGAVAEGLDKYAGKWAGVLFAIALIDASVIGAAAVSLSTAYAIGDVLSLQHSLHRKPGEAKGFYAVYCGLIAVAAGLVLAPGVALGLLTMVVQALAGVLLPGATMFLLLLCNDEAVLGPWINNRWQNALAGAIVAALLVLSVVLTVSILFPGFLDERCMLVLLGGTMAAVAIAFAVSHLNKRPGAARPIAGSEASGPVVRGNWRMPPFAQMPRRRLPRAWQIGMIALRLYLVIAAGLILVRIVALVFAGA